MRKCISVIAVLCIFLLLCLPGNAKGIKKGKIKRFFKHSKIVNDHFTGFALYDMDEQRMIFELNADKHFTPASNTKLFTFYTCLKLLGDSIPSIQYIEKGDSLIFWGTGDPSLLHSDLKSVKVWALLKNTNKKIFYAHQPVAGGHFGAGWAWDDYTDYYQAEINDLPLEDNTILASASKSGGLTISPAYMRSYLVLDSSYKPSSFRIRRDLVSNTFVYPAMPIPAKYDQQIPWRVSAALTVALLQDTLKKPIGLINMPLPANAKTLYDANADTVYRHMLQPSDNFIAEQLLLVCSSAKFGILDADSVIRYVKKNLLNDLPDDPQWADGSGLSRMNLFTPRSIIALLNKIHAEFKDEQFLHSLMPAGGVAGTIKSAYKTDNGQPFVWAKTGSLSNNHNQSGYIITRKGHRLAYSFMNNNFTEPSRTIRDEMVRIVTFIHENY